MDYDYTHIKNIVFAGAAGSGKTSLCESLLSITGAVERAGKIENGNTVSDWTDEEIRRKSSVYASLMTIENNGFKYNLIDTPGAFDFEGEEIEGISASDSGIITVSAKSGVKYGTHKAYRLLKKYGKPHMFVVTKIDDENANFNNVLTELKAEFGPSVCPVTVPVIENNNIVSYVNLIEMKAYKYNEKGIAVETDMPTAETSEKMGYRLEGLREAMSEAVAETDEELFEKFFSGEQFTQKELIDGIHKGVKSGIITPVTCCSALKSAGVDMLLKEMELLLPVNLEDDTIIAEDQNYEPFEIEQANPDSPFTAYVFKTVNDAFAGRMSYIKINSGKIKTGDEVFVPDKEEVFKVGKLLHMQGKKQINTSELAAGDIGVILKANINTGNTLCDPSIFAQYDKADFPTPNYSRAVVTDKGSDDSKISSALMKICEEDLTIKFEIDENTREQILSGLGEQHLLSKINEIKDVYDLDLVLKVPKIAYKETIRKKVRVQGKHKKQSGGHGQYGDVWIEFEPSYTDSLIFEERIVGGAVPKNYFPAVEKGISESMKKGVLGGFPVIGVKAILVDGSYHPVDSSEMAFKIAASLAYKEGMKQADPVLLEPIGALKVVTPDKFTGDIIGEINKRRGRINGMQPAKTKGNSVIEAEVPVREMADFATVMRQITQGSGTFTFKHEKYEPLPQNLLKDVLLESED